MAEIEFKATASICGEPKNRIISINKQEGSITVYKKDKSKKIVTHSSSFITQIHAYYSHSYPGNSHSSQLRLQGDERPGRPCLHHDHQQRHMVHQARRPIQSRRVQTRNRCHHQIQVREPPRPPSRAQRFIRPQGPPRLVHPRGLPPLSFRDPPPPDRCPRGASRAVRPPGLDLPHPGEAAHPFNSAVVPFAQRHPAAGRWHPPAGRWHPSASSGHSAAANDPPAEWSEAGH